MRKFEALECVIMSTPIIEMESPFYLTFDVKVQGDVVPATFIGNFARALKNNILVGGKAIIRDGFIDNGRLVFDFLQLPSSAKLGHTINVMA
jgi:hypothetical protein